MLAEYYAEYEKDPDFVAEGLALSIIDNALYAMERQGITRSQLAAAMGIPKSQVSRIFNAPPNLTLRSIARIALALEVKPQELLDCGRFDPAGGRPQCRRGRRRLDQDVAGFPDFDRPAPGVA